MEKEINVKFIFIEKSSSFIGCFRIHIQIINIMCFQSKKALFRKFQSLYLSKIL